jgi:hypothetical protein
MQILPAHLAGPPAAVAVDALPHARYAAESFEIDVQEIADVRPFVPLDRPRLEQRHPIESGARQHPRHR